MTEILGIYHKN